MTFLLNHWINKIKSSINQIIIEFFKLNKKQNLVFVSNLLSTAKFLKTKPCKSKYSTLSFSSFLVGKHSFKLSERKWKILIKFCGISKDLRNFLYFLPIFNTRTKLNQFKTLQYLLNFYKNCKIFFKLYYFHCR